VSGPSHGGKGDAQRPASTPGAYAAGYGRIDWTARDRGSAAVVDSARRVESQMVDRAKAKGE